MKTIHFSARLLADAVISERGATIGGHRCLDYIPGATFLGAAAGKLYKDSFNAAFTVFHSGKVRFGNAYPLVSTGEPALPIPLSWHAPKGKEADSVTEINNLAHASEQQFDEWDKAGEQQKPLRNGYFTPSGARIDPARTYRLKTAINRDKQGMADDGQLFGYQSLTAGSTWYFSVAFDDDVPQDVKEEVCDALTTGDIRVGRSRSAEYGLLKVNKVDVRVDQQLVTDCNRLFLFCTSDLALADPDTGAPVLVPSASHFGLVNATLNKQKSYLRVRSYAPFNSRRRRFDLERQVLAKGSVLVFEREGGFCSADMALLQSRLEKGIGLYRQDGLGQLLVNPAFLTTFSFTPFQTGAYALPQETASTILPPVAEWLKEKAVERNNELSAIKQVDTWINDLVAGPCPKNSQWGQLRTIAVQEKDLYDIEKKLRVLCGDGVSQKQWNKWVTVAGKKTTYGEFILKTVLDDPLDQVRKRLYLLGNRLPRKNNQRNGGVR